MAKFRIKKSRPFPVTIMMPRGSKPRLPIGTTDSKGVFETDNEEHIEILNTDVRYDYIEPVEGKRRAKSDAANSGKNMEGGAAE